MTSIRYIILAILYIIAHYIIAYNEKDAEHNNILLHNPLFVLFLITFIFIYIIKYNENKNCRDKQLPQKYIFSQSIFYGLISICTHYLYNFVVDKECVDNVLTIFKQFQTYTYIPEAFFIAGVVLLLNQINYLFYPKCKL